MQMNEIRQRVQHAQAAIEQASRLCQEELLLPMELKDSIQQLDEKSGQMSNVLASADEQALRQCVDDLEQLGDRARDACKTDAPVAEEVRRAVMQAHRELSDLKHSLH
ncbi:hypothetical protein SAMN06265795_102126 [Noviherbaspirillum humi]|uniref:Uncharacterized protein n=1 Tax=Noviherbaspirillum humi TaxID=1688639 RepID=A0A239DD39_9BURK|nr:hypothetical protein [Noviherbaspirillum humi]SNS30346.1 hypothetical protein SAMN06265795_102126 [Noviherbaspirillum humi]